MKMEAAGFYKTMVTRYQPSFFCILGGRNLERFSVWDKRTMKVVGHGTST